MLQVVGKDRRVERLRVRGDPEGSGSWVLFLVLLLLAIVLTRASAFGNPVYSADDQLYLQFGQAIDSGQIPYVDIWDRKPIGLFLVYAAMGLLPGDPVYVYQFIASLFVLATALLIHRIARLFAGEWGSQAAALAFVILLPVFKGAAGQAQIFYEPLIALAALVVVSSERQDGGPSPSRGLAAMLLCGIAFTMKQTVIVESAFLGLWLLVAQWRRTGLPSAIPRGAMLMLAFAAPTLMTFAGMAMIGQLATYLDSSFLSVFHKGSDAQWSTMVRAIACFLMISPLIGFAIGGYVVRRNPQARLPRHELFLLLWTLAALGGVVLIPRFYLYYPIPLLLPLSISASTLFERRGTGPLYLMCLAVVTLVQGDVLRFADTRAARSGFSALSDDIRARARARPGGCLFVADGPGLLYATSGVGCRTPYRFPDHLSLPTEADSIGADPAQAVRDILAQRPAVIVLRLGSANEARNPVTWPIIQAALASDYRPVRRYRFPVEYRPQSISVWARK